MKRKIIFFLLIISNIIFAQTIVEWYTSMGNFKAELREDLVPITAQNFIDLTNSCFYDNLIFHRVINNFVIQDGDPLGTGYGGPGYTIPDEFCPDLHHDSAGVLAMANTGAPNSAGSQYYITLSPQPQLDGSYAIFGNVIEGIDVVLAIGDVPTDANDHPITPVNIDSIRVLTPQIDSFNPEETELSVDLNETVTFVVISFDANVTYSWYVNDELQTETGFMYFYTFNSNGIFDVKCVISNGSGYDSTLEWIISSGTINVEDNLITVNNLFLTNYPNPFNPTTTIKFNIANTTTNLDLIISNLQGQTIRKIHFDRLTKGKHSILWNGKDKNGKSVASGVYLYKLSGDKHIY